MKSRLVWWNCLVTFPLQPKERNTFRGSVADLLQLPSLGWDELPHGAYFSLLTIAGAQDI